MYRNFICGAMACGICLSFSSLLAQSPGGVARQSLWLRGNFFSDSSGNQILNFNPATSLEGKKSVTMPGNITNLRRATVFTVYRNPVVEDARVWQINGDFGDLSLTTHEVASQSEKMTMVFKKPESKTSNSGKSVAVISTYLRQQASVPGNNNNTPPVVRFGNTSTSTPTTQPTGLIAEFIVYETLLKEKQVARVESYLAIKYGITLEKNYVNSSGQTIWNRKLDSAFSHNIAGVGRDDRTLLYQKQGTSSGADDQLVIGIKSITPNNALNTGQLSDGDYMLWGDNGKPFVLEQQNSQQNSDVILSQKKWRMNLSRKTLGAVATQLKIDTKTLMPASLPNGYFCLVIDRSGAGDFAPQHCDYILPDSVSGDGIASFSGIHWDTDASGKDAFSFGLKTRLSADANRPVTFQVFPNPLIDGHYNVAVTLDKPADIRVRIYDIHLHLVDSKDAYGQANYLLPGTIRTAAGVYIVKLFTNDKEFSQLIIRP